MDPMLARNLNPKDLDRYIQDDDWYAQQKLDGIRILVTADSGNITGVGRSGRTVNLGEEFDEAFGNLEGRWLFDGEFVGTGNEGQMWFFDMPEGGDIIHPDDAYEKRYMGLEVTFGTLDLYEDFKLVSLARTPEQKMELLTWCRDNNAEGVMFKKRDGKYLSGVRSNDMLKGKFTQTVDCVILEVGREGKESVAVGAYKDGVLTDIGSVKMTASQGLGDAHVGDVIEVRYLYVQSENMRLYQPVFLKFRPDRDAKSCTTDQLKYTNKSVRKD